MLARWFFVSLMVALTLSDSCVVETEEQDGVSNILVVIKKECGDEGSDFQDTQVLKDYPRDCTDLLERNSEATSGAYMINIRDGGKPFRVYCDMDTDGIIVNVYLDLPKFLQNVNLREDGSMNFYRNWPTYKAGFGNVNSEHWLGNDNIHRLTSDGQFELRVDMSTFEGESAYANYGNFRIGDEESNYKLICGNYSGNAGDSLSYHNNHRFSTFDQDHDTAASSCSVSYKGAWWYRYVGCHVSNLNGLYLGGTTDQFATDYPRDCTDILESNSEATSGAYMINIHDGGEPFRVYCDMDTDGGG
ncbi:fibrinogen-like protein A [Antedon mediterranea]|uniref:fibrinogen-like protein A n=1 Tax=Antedon mediterranea TaxID=105859 RepID=UPI003AF4AEF4